MGSPGVLTGEYMNTALTLASYNIHSGIGTDGKFDLCWDAAVL